MVLDWSWIQLFYNPIFETIYIPVSKLSLNNQHCLGLGFIRFGMNLDYFICLLKYYLSLKLNMCDSKVFFFSLNVWWP
jgi:hypothetical protein